MSEYVPDVFPLRAKGSQFKQDEPSRHDLAAARKAEDERLERVWNKEIDTRDHKRCRCCGKASDPDRLGLLVRGHRAHLVYASAGGSMEPSNRVTLCHACHADEHADRLRFAAEGGPYVGIDARLGMEFWRKDSSGGWYLEHRELAPGIIEKD